MSDVAIVFPGREIVQDRYEETFSSSHHSCFHHLCSYSMNQVNSSIDSQQDFCIMESNMTGKNLSLSFERNVTTGDIHDLNLMSNVSLVFSMGVYTTSNDGNTFDLQPHFFRQLFDQTVSFVRCHSSKKL